MRIDLNSDMGESFGRWKLGDDHALLDVVSSANVACGFHAGDPAGMLRTLSDAAANGVCVGAHVAYHDLDGFGRRFVDEQPADLTADVMYQIAALEGLAASVGTRSSPSTRRSPCSHCPARWSANSPRTPDCRCSARRSPTARTCRTARWCRARRTVR